MESTKISHRQMRIAWEHYRQQLQDELREITRQRDKAIADGNEEAAIEANEDGIATIRELEAIGAWHNGTQLYYFKFS